MLILLAVTVNKLSDNGPICTSPRHEIPKTTSDHLDNAIVLTMCFSILFDTSEKAM